MISTIERKRNRDVELEAVVKVVQDSLERSAYSALKNILCEYDGEVLILRGKMPSYYHKQLAQEAVRRIEGISQVINEIEVKLSHPR